MEKKKDLLYEKFKDRCSDNGITGEESGDIEMCWIIARDILTQERKQELDRAREEGWKNGIEHRKRRAMKYFMDGKVGDDLDLPDYAEYTSKLTTK